MIEQAIGQFISKLMTSKNTGYSDGLDAFGNFDPESYVNANLSKAKGTPGTDLPKVTQGIAHLLGLGPKQMVGTNGSTPPGESNAGAPMTGATPTGKLDDSWLRGLGLGGRM